MTDETYQTGTAPNWEHVRTQRLVLDAPTDSDLDGLYQLHHDPRSWTHLPHRRHLDPERTRSVIDKARQRFARDRLSYWCVRLKPDGPVIGWGGCSIPSNHPWWNLTYRIAPDHWGRGYASEVVLAGITAATSVRPELPVLAFVMENNPASIRVLERAGLRLHWSGPDRSSPGLTRLVYLDREVDEHSGSRIVAAMSPKPVR
jgi:RimJ/RimL family protein N-acetyltransferase